MIEILLNQFQKETRTNESTDLLQKVAEHFNYDLTQIGRSFLHRGFVCGKTKYYVSCKKLVCDKKGLFGSWRSISIRVDSRPETDREIRPGQNQRYLASVVTYPWLCPKESVLRHRERWLFEDSGIEEMKL